MAPTSNEIIGFVFAGIAGAIFLLVGSVMVFKRVRAKKRAAAAAATADIEMAALPPVIRVPRPRPVMMQNHTMASAAAAREVARRARIAGPALDSVGGDRSMLGGDLGRRRRGRGLDGEEWDVGGALRGRSGLDEAGDSEEFVLVPLGREVPEIRIWTPNGHRFAYRRRKEN